MSKNEKTFNCAFTIAFQVSGCKTENAEDITAQEIRNAINKRINSLSDEELVNEAVGAPYDSHVEE